MVPRAAWPLHPLAGKYVSGRGPMQVKSIALRLAPRRPRCPSATRSRGAEIYREGHLRSFHHGVGVARSVRGTPMPSASGVYDEEIVRINVAELI